MRLTTLALFFAFFPGLAAAQVVTLEFESTPGPDGLLGTADDELIDAPTVFSSQSVQLTDEFAALGIRFIPNPPSNDFNEVLDAASFSTPPEHTMPNILAASGTNTIEAEFTVPVFRVSALIGISGGADEMEIFDANGASLGTVIGDDEVVTLMSTTPIARVLVRPSGSTTPAIDNLEFEGSGTVGTPFCDPANANSTGQPTRLTGTMGSGVGSGLHLEASQGPPGEFGYFLIGTTFVEPGILISQGRLCVSGAIGRYNALGGNLNSTGQFDAAGIMQNFVGTATSTGGSGFDVPTTIPTTGSPSILPGSTYTFQLWHREAAGAANFSNGLEITF